MKHPKAFIHAFHEADVMCCLCKSMREIDSIAARDLMSIHF